MWGSPFAQHPGRRGDLLGWRARVGRSSSTAPLGQWPGLAWPGRLVFLTNGASQPHALSILSCPDCPVLRARVTPGKAQGQHTQQDTSQQVTWPQIPSGQILRQPVYVARTHWDGGCQQGGLESCPGALLGAELRESQRAVGNPTGASRKEGRGCGG